MLLCILQYSFMNNLQNHELQQIYDKLYQYQQQLLQQQHANMMMMMNQVSGGNQGQKPDGGGNGKTPNRPGATTNTTTKRKKIKLPRTCFVIFRSEQNADIKKKHPNLDFGDISKEIARRWKSLSPED